jgi:hypothetical protein
MAFSGSQDLLIGLTNQFLTTGKIKALQNYKRLSTMFSVFLYEAVIAVRPLYALSVPGVKSCVF